MQNRNMPRIYKHGLNTFKKLNLKNRTTHYMFVSEFEYLLTERKLDAIAIEINDVFRANYDLSSLYTESLFETSKYFIFEGSNGFFDEGFFADNLKGEDVEDIFILLPDYADIKKECINDILTLKEAASIWNKDTSTIRRRIVSNKLKEGIAYRKSGSTWLITRESMLKLYGEPEFR